jgi:hypothetical protein
VSSDRRELSRYPARRPSAAIGHIHRTVDVGWQQPLTAWPAVVRAVPPRWVPTQDIGVPLRRPFLTAMPCCRILREWSGRAARGALRDGFIGACARSGRPSAGAASRGNLGRTWLPLTVSSGLTRRGLVSHQPRCSESPIREHELSSSWSASRALRCCAQPMVHKWISAPNYLFILLNIPIPNSIGRRPITITPERTE